MTCDVLVITYRLAAKPVPTIENTSATDAITSAGDTRRDSEFARFGLTALSTIRSSDPIAEPSLGSRHVAAAETQGIQ
ncbi:MAG TPA: hypothetical protein VGJ79_07845, partial [Candidatus Dormibacteraeota bacterium]